MITLKANTEMNVAEFLEEYPFYLFVFGNDCNQFKYVFAGEACEGFILFTILVDMPSGVYDLKIYGQSSSTNEDESLAEFLLMDSAKIYNPVDNCYNMPYLLDENNYIITSDEDVKIKYK